MSTIIVSEAGTFGPFMSIQTLEDRLHADGVDFQFDVIGSYTITYPSAPVAADDPPVLVDPEVPIDEPTE
ncbi:hypothetical protein GTP45_01085 [Pseudoduganella sp. FT55W]|uniref:Uncharacterized protein n=1 Tax=Duganella rivi TaxID=2666083 RepID=A0A7X4GL03_9BURK|nr:hypothetical protein [Duganella rivi]MYM65426.1 hypothetical protein [Duganella rivi]